MLRSTNNIKHIIASGGGNLEANAGESFLIKGMACVASTNDTYITSKVDRVTVGYHRVAGKSGNHLGGIESLKFQENLWGFLEAQGINMAIPVPEGSKFTIERYAEAGNVRIYYDVYDANDIQATHENGPAAKTFSFINYAGITSLLTATGFADIDKSLNPSEFPQFPFGKVVPAGMSIELLGFAGQPHCDGAAGPIYFNTNYLKFMRDRKVLFSEDGTGPLFYGDVAPGTGLEYNAVYSEIGSGCPQLVDSNVINVARPWILDQPIRFKEGETLTCQCYFTKSGAHTQTANLLDLAAILRCHKL